jgi:hypothetical protein
MSVAYNDILQVTARWTLFDTGDNQNVFACQSENVLSVPDDEVLEDMAEWMEDLYTPLLSNMCITLATDTVVVKNVTQSTDVGYSAWPSITGGSSSNDALPSGVAALVIAGTGVIKHYGRKFFPGFTVVSQVLGEWTSGTLTALASAGTVWITPFTSTNGHDWRPGIIRRDTGAFLPFTDTVARAVCAYQRRRRQGTGI